MSVRIETPADNIVLATVEVPEDRTIYASLTRDRDDGTLEVSLHRSSTLWDEDTSACVEGLTPDQARAHIDRLIEALRMLQDSI